MTIIDEINTIALKLAQEGMEIPSFALFGPSKYTEFLQQYPQASSRYETRIYTIFGALDIKVNARLPDDHLSIGGHALYDLYVDDILLDRDTSWFDESIMNK